MNIKKSDKDGYPSSPPSQDSQAAPLNEEDIPICKKYTWGICTKYTQCKYRHVLDIDFMKEQIKFCHNYQNKKGCTGEDCTYLHTTREEEKLFHAKGQIPRVLAERHASMAAAANGQNAETLPEIARFIESFMGSPNHLSPLPVGTVVPMTQTTNMPPLIASVPSKSILHPVPTCLLSVQQPPPPPPLPPPQGIPSTGTLNWPPTGGYVNNAVTGPISNIGQMGSTPNSTNFNETHALSTIAQFDPSRPPPAISNHPLPTLVSHHATKHKLQDTPEAGPSKMRKHDESCEEDLCLNCVLIEKRTEAFKKHADTLQAEDERISLLLKKSSDDYQLGKKILMRLVDSDFFRSFLNRIEGPQLASHELLLQPSINNTGTQLASHELLLQPSINNTTVIDTPNYASTSDLVSQVLELFRNANINSDPQLDYGNVGQNIGNPVNGFTNSSSGSLFHGNHIVPGPSGLGGSGSLGSTASFGLSVNVTPGPNTISSNATAGPTGPSNVLIPGTTRLNNSSNMNVAATTPVTFTPSSIPGANGCTTVGVQGPNRTFSDRITVPGSSFTSTAAGTNGRLPNTVPGPGGIGPNGPNFNVDVPGLTPTVPINYPYNNSVIAPLQPVLHPFHPGIPPPTRPFLPPQPVASCNDTTNRNAISRLTVPHPSTTRPHVATRQHNGQVSYAMGRYPPINIYHPYNQ